MSAADIAVVDGLAKGVLDASKGQIDGIWLGIWSPEKGTMIGSYGKADIAKNVAATNDDRGRIGSVTKSVISTLVLQQVAAGKLSKSDTIASVLPDVAATYPLLGGVTVEQMLTMTSGIPDYTEVTGGMTQIATDPAYAPTPTELIAKAMTGATALGTEGHYSNTNYILLGLILDKLAGKPANQQANDLVSGLGMSSTSLPAPGDNAIPAPASVGYNHDGGLKSLGVPGVKDGPAIDNISNWGWTAGSMYSDVKDLSVWASTGLGSSLLPKDLAQARIDGAKPINGGIHIYSEGLQDFGNGWIGHEGQAVGWESIVAYNTKTGAAWVSIVNETTGNMSVATVQQKFFPDLTDGEFIKPMMAAAAVAGAGATDSASPSPSGS